jgi:hypothetical protein
MPAINDRVGCCRMREIRGIQTFNVWALRSNLLMQVLFTGKFKLEKVATIKATIYTSLIINLSTSIGQHQSFNNLLGITLL